MTIPQAKIHLRDHWQEGLACPCCGQYVKLYRRSIHSRMARALLLMRATLKGDIDEQYIDVHKMFADLGEKPNNDYVKLAYWGLIEPKEGNRDDKSPRNGLWRITSKGLHFAQDELTVAKYVYVYNKRVYMMSEGQTDIISTLKNKFNYQDLINYEK